MVDIPSQVLDLESFYIRLHESIMLSSAYDLC